MVIIKFSAFRRNRVISGSSGLYDRDSTVAWFSWTRCSLLALIHMMPVEAECIWNRQAVLNTLEKYGKPK